MAIARGLALAYVVPGLYRSPGSEHTLCTRVLCLTSHGTHFELAWLTVSADTGYSSQESITHTEMSPSVAAKWLN